MASDAELAELSELTNTKLGFPKAKLCWIPPSVTTDPITVIFKVTGLF